MYKVKLSCLFSRPFAQHLALLFASACLLSTFAPVRAKANKNELRPAAALTLSVAGADGSVTALTGEGDYLYVGGSFHNIGGISANGVARFNYKTGVWTALGTGIGLTGNGVAGFVEDIAVSGKDVYVVGGFSRVYSDGTHSTSANNIARWDTATGLWNSLGSGSGLSANGVNQRVDDVLISGSNVYLGGAFTSAYNASGNSIFANGVARWNGSSWAALGNGAAVDDNGVLGGQGWVHSLALIGTNLYVGGSFSRAINSAGNEVSTNNVACWGTTNNTWTALGTGSGPKANGTDFSLNAIAASGTDLIVGGGIFNAYNSASNIVPVNAVARWSTTSKTWSLFNGASGVAKNGVSGFINTIHVSGANIYLGGAFPFAYNADGTSVSANNIVRWNGSAWRTLGASSGSTGNGVDGQNQTILDFSNILYAGGTSQKAYNSTSSAVDAPYLARWNTVAWSDVSGPSLKSLGTSSAASFINSRFASEQIVSAFGTALATVTAIAKTLPLPTNLGGTTVKVRDSLGNERLAPLFFVSDTQVNFQIPPGTANGNASITITSADGSGAGGLVPVMTIAPGLFAANANGQGVAAAVALRVKISGLQSYESVFQLNAGAYTPIPIDLGVATDQVYLILYGTGLRFRSGLSGVMAQIGGVAAEVSYAGPQGVLTGLDQVNIRIPRSLIGRGLANVTLTVDGIATNTVQVNIK